MLSLAEEIEISTRLCPSSILVCCKFLFGSALDPDVEKVEVLVDGRDQGSFQRSDREKR
jgi:hypothetical protein